MTRTPRFFSLAAAAATGAALPWLVDGSVVVVGGPGAGMTAYVLAWALWLVAAAGLLVVMGRSRIVSVAAAAAIGGLSAMLFVAVLHAFPAPWVLALWPQALAVGVLLPLLAIVMARIWRRRPR
jgi:hypothetical protein